MEKCEHKFWQVDAGGNGENSWSHQKCEKCGAVFTHYYNRETYEKAKKRIVE